MIRRTFLESLLGTAVAMPTAAKADLRPDTHRPVVLQHSPLAGFQYHAGEAVWADLATGDPLDLVREPANPHDHGAVAVHWRGRELRCIPRLDNCAVAQLLDRGKSVSARILRLKEPTDPRHRVTLEFSLPNAP